VTVIFRESYIIATFKRYKGKMVTKTWN